MEAKIDLIGIITSKFQEMLLFYRDVLGFKVRIEMESYVEFENPGVRFAISTHKVMTEATKHKSFSQGRRGQSFELAFLVQSPGDVDKTYDEIVKKGATPVKSPEDMPWNQRAAFFADPDGNIHEVFAELPKTDSSF